LPTQLQGKEGITNTIMATFSLGTSGITPGAPGVYVNESAGSIAPAAISSFSTVYMLVEAPEEASTAVFPYNTPTPVTSISDYKALVGGIIPTDRIPLLSYNCVNEFFQNAQVGDLRVVRVGTPNQIVEIEFFPSGTKIGSGGLPSALLAGDVVYVQMILNGVRLVAGDGSTGYTSSGEWLGVPVTIPVSYVAGDAENNRRISQAIATAVAEAIESNPSVRSAVYVRDFGLVNDIKPALDSPNGYVTVSASTFDGSVSVVTQVLPVGSQSVFMQNTYDIENIVGQQGNLTRVPQDYIQCITTAFDGQQDQGYLITPTAYAQFGAEGRSAVGAAAAEHCASNDFKWMALADPGPFLVTDINEYSEFTPHLPAEDLISGRKYLINNSIYQWTGENVAYDRLKYQTLLGGTSPQIAIESSVESVATGESAGLLDPGIFSVNSNSPDAELGKFTLGTSVVWPVEYTIKEVAVTDNPVGSDFETLGKTAYVVAPPYDVAVSGPYPNDGTTQYIYLASDPVAASNILTEVTNAGGTSKMVTAPTSAFVVAAPTGSSCTVSYGTANWDLPVVINGQSSNLIQNITDSAQSVNTLHLPGTLQEPTNTYRIGYQSRTILDPSASLSSSTVANFEGSAQFNVVSHGLINGEKLYFFQPIYTGTVDSELFQQTTKKNIRPYYVRVIDADNFVLASNLTAYSAGGYVQFPTAGVLDKPSIFYTDILGGATTSPSLAELTVVPFIRGRKFGIASGNVSIQPSAASIAPAPNADFFTLSMRFSDSSVNVSPDLISPYGETPTAGWLPELVLSPAGTSTTDVDNYYCVPTTEQNYASEAFLVPAFNPLLAGTYDGTGEVGTVTNTYVGAFGFGPAPTAAELQADIKYLVGCYFDVTVAGLAPDGTTPVAAGDRLAVTYDGSNYRWVSVIPDASGGSLLTVASVLYGSQVELAFTAEQTPPSNLWRFDAITSTEIIDVALRGVSTGGNPQAEFIESGIDSVNRLYDDSQRYFNPYGFIAYYGPYIKNASGQWIPPSPYVAGVALRRYRAEGYQFPPAGVKYQLSDAVATQISINSAQQNLLNPDGCNAIRSLPGYPSTSVFIWGGRTRINPDVAEQRLYQFVNTRVILNVVYGSLRTAFDNQIFNVIDGFGVVYNQIVSVGNSILNQLYVRGALFGARPSEAFQVICDERVNNSADLENGIVSAKVFVTPVPTLERIQIDLIRVSIGNMQNELNAQGLGQDNTSFLS
jgi:hypothetical protein